MCAAQSQLLADCIGIQDQELGCDPQRTTMIKRNRRAGVEDLWVKADKTRSARYGKGLRWRARYVDAAGGEHSKAFALKAEAQRWLDQQTAAVVTGKHVAPRDARITVAQWCDLWLDAYQGHRPKTVEGARVHVSMICSGFGELALTDVKPLVIKTWTARLTDDYATSTIARCHSRLRQIFEDAVNDGLMGSNPCSRRTSPPAGKAKVYCASTAQVWALYNVMPDRLRVAILLGAFAGLRVSEVCGLRVQDVNFLRGVIHPRQQWGGRPLKNQASDAPIPIPRDLVNMLAASVERYPSEMMVTSFKTGRCNPVGLQLAVAAARDKVDGLPEGFTFHDLRHFYASMLLASGADLIKVQTCMRHATASTTLNVYGHLLPDADEATNDAVSRAMALRA